MENGNSTTLLGRRALAYICDAFLVAALTVVTLSTLSLIPAMQSRVVALTTPAFLLTYVLYFTAAHARFGYTPGKRLMGLRLALPISLSRALARALLYFVSGHATLGLGFLLTILRKDGLTLHDLIMGTAVVEFEPAAGAAPEREAA